MLGVRLIDRHNSTCHHTCLGQVCELTCSHLKDIPGLTLDGFSMTSLESRVFEDMAVLRGDHTGVGQSLNPVSLRGQKDLEA